MSEESYYGAFCRGCGEMVAISGFTDIEMVMSFPAWERENIRIDRSVKRLKSSETGNSGPCKCVERDTHTFTTAELELLIKTACEMQKEHCVNVFSARYPVMHGPEARTIDRALCPKLADVLAKYEEVKKDEK